MCFVPFTSTQRDSLGNFRQRSPTHQPTFPHLFFFFFLKAWKKQLLYTEQEQKETTFLWALCALCPSPTWRPSKTPPHPPPLIVQLNFFSFLNANYWSQVAINLVSSPRVVRCSRAAPSTASNPLSQWWNSYTNLREMSFDCREFFNKHKPIVHGSKVFVSPDWLDTKLTTLRLPGRAGGGEVLLKPGFELRSS